MSTRKNIDKLYLNKFSQAEVAPPEEAWQNISARLPEKRNQKLLPLWLSYTGTAAIVAVLLGLGLLNNSSGSLSSGTVVKRQDIYKEIRLASTGFTEIMLQSSMTLQGLMQQNRKLNTPETRNSPSEVSAAMNIAFADRTAPYNFEDAILDKPMATISFSQAPKPDIEDVLVISGTKLSGVHPGSLGENSRHVPGLVKTIGNKEKNNLFSSSNRPSAAEGKDISVSEEKISQRAETDLAHSISEEVFPEKEEEARGRMSISTRIAPVFFNMGSGTARNAQLAGDGGSGKVSLSYGINLAYQVSDKLRIRSGVNKLDLSYSTPGVPMAAAVNSATFGEKSRPYMLTSSEEGKLDQQMGFIEVPIEMEYRLVNSRLDLNLIAGGSTLFLKKNEVSINSGRFSTSLGEANNLKNLSFSANLGLGIDYKLAPNFYLNLEPVFKYQLNTVNGDADLKPYYFGVYSGFSVSF